MRPIRVLVAKPGLDGHDRGAKVVAAALRDAGMEVIYTGLHQTPEQIVETVIQEDADAVVPIQSGLGDDDTDLALNGGGGCHGPRDDSSPPPCTGSRVSRVDAGARTRDPGDHKAFGVTLRNRRRPLTDEELGRRWERLSAHW